MASHRPTWAKKHDLLTKQKTKTNENKGENRNSFTFYGSNFSWKKPKHLCGLSYICLLTMLNYASSAITMTRCFPEKANAVALSNLQFFYL